MRAGRAVPPHEGGAHLGYAVVLGPEDLTRPRFREMVDEENRGSVFHLFATRPAAEDWLLDDAERASG